MKKILLLACILCSVCSFAQVGFEPESNPIARERVIQLNKAAYLPRVAHKTTSGSGPVFDTTLWSHRIDSVWGAGTSDSAKLSMFNIFWGQIDSFYACFVQLPAYNWDSIVLAMRTEISGGVSRGRFSGILGNLLTYISDAHTSFYDAAVNYVTPIYPGLPLFRGESGQFGACVTMLADSSAMVYYADPTHPFGLQPGDIILGYNGIRWTELVKTILRNQLPNAASIGSSPEATFHHYVQSAGENWYLFDTINIRKCDGSLVNLPTSLMVGTHYSHFCTEQLPQAGVHLMTYNEYFVSHRITSSGVLQGTNIGYVYMYDCTDASGGDTLLNAVRTLVEDSMVTGLILDVRTNYGGGFNAYISTFNYLNDGSVAWVGYGNRLDPTLRYAMTNSPSSWYNISDTDPSSFDYPVAVLAGPCAYSAGDFFPVLFKRDEHVRIFGKSTAGAYGARTPITMPVANYSASRQEVNFYDVNDPTYYLSHTSVPVDTAVWLRQDSVCHGVDNIVTTAVDWIHHENVRVQEVSAQLGVRLYPNPTRGNVTMAINTIAAADVQVSLINMLGTTIDRRTLHVNGGDQSMKLPYADLHLPSGTYQVVVQGDGLKPVVKKVTVL